jgi:hypothetical protein
MGYSDLPQEKVNSIIEEIKETTLFVDLLLKEKEMIRTGKVNNDAFRFLQNEIASRYENRDKKRGR